MPRCPDRRTRTQAIAFDPRDNVATSLVDLRQGTQVFVATSKASVTLVARQRIPIGHKIALKPVRKEGLVVKYGEAIGRATKMIKKGDHVHTHNLTGTKQRGQKPRRRQR